MRGFNELKETLHNNALTGYWMSPVRKWGFQMAMIKYSGTVLVGFHAQHDAPDAEEVCRISINKMKAATQDSGP